MSGPFESIAPQLTTSQSFTTPSLVPDPLSQSLSVAPSQVEDKKIQEQALKKLEIGNEFTVKNVEANDLTAKWHQTHRIIKLTTLALPTVVSGLTAVAALVGAVALTVLGAAVTAAVGAVGMGLALPGVILASPYAALKLYQNYQESKILKPLPKRLEEISKTSDEWDLKKLSSSPRNLDLPNDQSIEVSNHILSLSRAYRRCSDTLPKSPESERDQNLSQDTIKILNEKQPLISTKKSIKAIEERYFTKIHAKLNQIDKLLAENKPVDKLLRSIESDYEKCLKEICKENHCSMDANMFKETCKLERGRGVREMNNNFSFYSTDFRETATPLSTSAGLDYLKLKTQGKPNKTLKPCIEHLESAEGIRPSSLKKHQASQATTINLFEHTLSYGKRSINPDYRSFRSSCVLRSGAFAVHGQPRIAELKHELAEEKGILSTLEKRFKSLNDGMTTKANLAKIENRIEKSKGKIKAIQEKIKAAQKGPQIGLHELKKQFAEIAEIQINHSSIGSMPNTQLSKKATEALIKKIVALGFTSIQEIAQEIETRQNLVVAQALPKIVHSLKNMVKDPEALAIAQKTCRFLHVEESFLSHLDSHEKGMIEDMKGAMDHLRDNCEIILDSTMPEDAEPKIELDSQNPQKIIIRLRKPPENSNLTPEQSKKAKEERTTFGLSALMFTTGVNENQTIGHVYGKYNQLQAEINADGLNHLEAYAQEALKDSPAEMKKASDALKKVKEHYSEATTRAAKDMQGLELRRALVKSLHGGKGVVCKSGKDRTAGETCRDLASDAGNDNNLVDEVVLLVRNKLLEGASHKITGVNIGKNGYCFNMFQRLFIPKNMCPPARLCGGGES